MHHRCKRSFNLETTSRADGEAYQRLIFQPLPHSQSALARVPVCKPLQLRNDAAHRADDDAERARAVWHAAEIGGAHMVRELTPMLLFE